MANRPPTTSLSYTVRRDEPTRIEGFSDAVFGLSLTLLAFSLGVPKSIDELKLIAAAQLVPTLAAFALMCWIWAEHNSFFRQFGLQDSMTVVLNCALLFLVVFYTYPLKFMAVFLWEMFADIFGWQGIEAALHASGSILPGQRSRTADVRGLMTIYHLGFIALFAIFALLYRHALKQKDVLQLDDVELFEARAGLRVQLISVVIGVVAFSVMLILPSVAAGASGMVYMLMGPAHGIHGARYGRERAKLLAAKQAGVAERV